MTASMPSKRQQLKANGTAQTPMGILGGVDEMRGQQMWMQRPEVQHASRTFTVHVPGESQIRDTPLELRPAECSTATASSVDATVNR
eukprot:CAMPEP_0119112534 /NCGR_PEP_ID=MMETSP1180-20130426/40663_1 /TAXON_ID=3052 ORGANISM="Chlamydomonas cf sp, Strain CCMP681" /NCGR_SAMPLE_ID=MMETSP1180 /ASSEMBLY_ACC=CAM_ASM_000741 /LENGTH=86 /DNA_ID=CAMNT_0007100081 /DNA_START=27 /DNA_END=285 /DNA_ORIENTATION=+